MPPGSARSPYHRGPTPPHPTPEGGRKKRRRRPGIPASSPSVKRGQVHGAKPPYRKQASHTQPAAAHPPRRTQPHRGRRSRGSAALRPVRPDRLDRRAGGEGEGPLPSRAGDGGVDRATAPRRGVIDGLPPPDRRGVRRIFGWIRLPAPMTAGAGAGRGGPAGGWSRSPTDFSGGAPEKSPQAAVDRAHRADQMLRGPGRPVGPCADPP